MKKEQENEERAGEGGKSRRRGKEQEKKERAGAVSKNKRQKQEARTGSQSKKSKAGTGAYLIRSLAEGDITSNSEGYNW